jgi:hypothetical protein
MYRVELRRTLRRLERLAHEGVGVLSALERLADKVPRQRVRSLNRALSDIETQITTLLRSIGYGK